MTKLVSFPEKFKKEQGGTLWWPQRCAAQIPSGKPAAGPEMTGSPAAAPWIRRALTQRPRCCRLPQPMAEHGMGTRARLLLPEVGFLPRITFPWGLPIDLAKTFSDIC